MTFGVWFKNLSHENDINFLVFLISKIFDCWKVKSLKWFLVFGFLFMFSWHWELVDAALLLLWGSVVESFSEWVFVMDSEREELRKQTEEAQASTNSHFNRSHMCCLYFSIIHLLFIKGKRNTMAMIKQQIHIFLKLGETRSCQSLGC